jgi:prepilin-type N-terminal cleavage/methylation domain-containing protein
MIFSKRSSGFTLVEVLVALAVFSAVLSLVLFGLEQGRSSWMRGHKHATFLSEMSHRQFWIMRMFSQANAATFAIDYGLETSYFFGTKGELSLISEAPVISGPGTYALVRLKVEDDPESGKESLVLYEWDNRDPYYGLPRDTSNAQKLVLFENITDASWKYWLDARDTPTPLETMLNNFVPRDSDEWSGEYDSRFEVKLPAKVKFSFKLKGQLYAWVFSLNQYFYAAGQNEPLVVR